MKNILSIWYKRIFKNVRHKYRLVVMDESFQEKFSFRLSRSNVFVSVGLLAIVLIVGTTLLITFTSLREFIPGYIRQDVVNMSYENAIKIDSLQYEIQKQSNYIHAMNLVISGQMPLSKMENVKDSMKNYEDIEYTTSKADEILRAEIENTNVYDALKKSNIPSTKVSQITSFASNRVSDIFYLPLQGTVIRDFDRGEKHFGIDISGKKQAIIRAIQNGTIISADWSPTFAYVISIQHSNNMTSVYKYNSAILKQVGDHVKAGEPIGFIGNFGDNYKGPMLHFELWYNGSPVNPKDYIPL